MAVSSLCFGLNEEPNEYWCLLSKNGFPRWKRRNHFPYCLVDNLEQICRKSDGEKKNEAEMATTKTRRNISEKLIVVDALSSRKPT